MNISKIMNGIDSSNSSSRNNRSDDNNGSISTNTSSSRNERNDVQLSASSKSIQQIEAEIRRMSDVDDATVDRIRSALQNGNYQIDYEKLAGKMLDFEERLN